MRLDNIYWVPTCSGYGFVTVGCLCRSCAGVCCFREVDLSITADISLLRNRSILIFQAVFSSSFSKNGSLCSGSPALPHRRALKILLTLPAEDTSRCLTVHLLVYIYFFCAVFALYLLVKQHFLLIYRRVLQKYTFGCLVSFSDG